MPIRFDSGGDENKNNSNLGGGKDSGDNRGAIAILLLIVFFIFRKPKIAIPLLIVAAILFLIFAPEDTFDSPNENGEELFSTGCEINQDIYDKTEVFEPLAAGSSKNKLPSSVSLLKYAPTRRNQGEQGSCVGWASAYSARTIVESMATGKSPNDVAFSPSFLYNQIALQGCQGSYTSEALKKMKNDGLLFFNKFPYNERSCNGQPTRQQLDEAKAYRIRGYNRLSVGGSQYDVDMDAVKQNIAQGGPVVIAMKVPESFYYVNGELWQPKSGEANNIDRLGGHAMCAIGYDDNKFGGAIQVMNSWGRDWGSDGVFWMKYQDFATYVREAYGLYPHPKAQTSSTTEFSVSFGLIASQDVKGTSGSIVVPNGQNVPLKQKQGNLFQTVQPINKGSKFKIEVSNTIECFTYVFGQETDGSSYVLFPYSEKHSPYCGIVGTRHFPKGKENLIADNIGNKDFMAIVVSKEALDYKDLNNRINRSKGRTYVDKLNDALSSKQLNNVKFSAGKTVVFKGSAVGSRNVVGAVIEIDKN